MEIEKSDVLVIGSGGAGLRAAIEFSGNGIDVVVVGKCRKKDAHTTLATGGINAALRSLDPQDSWELHAADTIRDGGEINNPAAVKILCRNAPLAVKELAEWGAKFHREKDGRITQRFFGAATYRRACFVGDHTGREILDVLVNQAEKRKIRFRGEVYIFSLLGEEKINGAVGLKMNTGKIVVFHCKAVVIATGGHSKMFSRSSSRFWENNGDGIYLAYRAGAKFMDMEMFQFHPTGMVYPPEAEGMLVTEAVRGEGGILTNAGGERFMKRYDPERMELSARDIVARAIYNEVKEGRGTKHNGVWLDISHTPKSYILKRLPSIYRQFKQYAGLDISRQKMEVAPTAHYSMGGILVNHATGETTVKNLFAIGEVTSGLHGANRLGGNSLAEIIVFGKLTAQAVAKKIKKIKLIPLDDKMIKEEELLSLNSGGKNPVEVKKEIQRMMWKYCGVVRNETLLNQALRRLEKFGKAELDTGKSLKRNERLIAALDVRNMVPTCEMIIRSALFRKESRGAHYRSDYPETGKNWKRNVVCTPLERGIKVLSSPIPRAPEAIRRLMNKKRKYHALE